MALSQTLQAVDAFAHATFNDECSSSFRLRGPGKKMHPSLEHTLVRKGLSERRKSARASTVVPVETHEHVQAIQLPLT